jgi:GNAT superfamily N-acetyltransferase
MGIKMKIKEITFEETLPFWKELWYPKTDIQKRSGRLLAGFNRSIITNDDIEVTFFGAEVDDKIVGVNSGYSPNDFSYRSRGLFVLPEYRHKGIAQRLLKATEENANKNCLVMIWSMPRITALKTYLNFGFVRISDFFDGEYGQNCFVVKGLL